MQPEREYPVYLLFIDLRSSVGGGFEPRVAQALKTLAERWGTAGTAMQHWAIMIDDHVYELARKLDGNGLADPGMNNNPNFKRPTATPFLAWQRDRKPKEVHWRKFWYTRKEKTEITAIAQDVAWRMQKYKKLDNNCQHFVTELYDRLESGYDTGAGWAVMSSEILPKQMPITAETAVHASASILVSFLSGFATLLTTFVPCN